LPQIGVFFLTGRFQVWSRLESIKETLKEPASKKQKRTVDFFFSDIKVKVL
jgi:hypothetical protein